MYLVYQPTFALNGSGTSVVVRWAIELTASPTDTTGSLTTYQGALGMSGSSGGTYVRRFPLESSWWGGAPTDTNAFLQVGYAVTANSGQQSVLPTQSDCVAVASPLPMMGTPSLGNSVIPTISATELTAEFAIPVRPSTFWQVFRITGGTQSLFTNPAGWYGHTGLAAASPGYDWDIDQLATWYKPNVTMSASPMVARQNASTTVTIQVPSWMRTLTASDFTVTGGTLSNFTQVP